MRNPSMKFSLSFTFISGYLDVLGMLALGNIFLSFMSGNSTFFGIYLATGQYGLMLKYASILLAFVLGSFIGTLICDDNNDHQTTVKTVILSVMILLIGALLIHHTDFSYLSFLIISMAMGLQNKAQLVINNCIVGKGFMTGVLYALGEGLANLLKGNTTHAHVFTIFISWLSFVVGATIGTLVLYFAGVSVSIALIIAFLFVLYLLASSTSSEEL